jgi:hypothetical protein
MTAGDACPRLSGTSAGPAAGETGSTDDNNSPCVRVPVRCATCLGRYLDCTSTPPRHLPRTSHLAPTHYTVVITTRPAGRLVGDRVRHVPSTLAGAHGPRPTASTRPPLASPLVTSRCERDTLSDSERLFLFRHCPIQPMGGMCHATLLHGCILPLLCIAPENRCRPSRLLVSNPVLSRFVCCFRCCTPTSACPSPVQSGS